VAESVESDMKLNSKLFIISLTTAIIFTFLILVTDHQNASAQTKNNKEISTEGKTAAPLVTFVEIGSINCIPCKAMQPIMKAVEEEYKGQVKIVFHDVWTAKGKADARIYNIRVIPTQVFLDKNGKEYYRHEGFFPKDDVVRVIKMQGVK
jgi:thioredoxin 1